MPMEDFPCWIRPSWCSISLPTGAHQLPLGSPQVREDGGSFSPCSSRKALWSQCLPKDWRC